MKTTKQSDGIHEALIDKNRKAILLITLLSIGTPFLIFFGIQNLYRQDTLVGIADLVVGGVIICTNLILIFKRNEITLRIASYCVLIFFGSLVLLNVASGGANFSQALWTYVFPLTAFFLLGTKEGSLCMAFFLLLLCLLLFGLVPLEVADYGFNFKLRFLLSLFVVTAMTFGFEIIRHHIQEKLLSSNKKLRKAENKTRAAYDELKKMHNQLIQSAKLASIGQLAASVAHEVNQPLQLIYSISDVLKQDINRETPDIEDINKKIDILNTNSIQMINIIKHLRTFSHKSDLSLFPQDINQIIEHSFIMMESQLEQRHIKVTKKLDAQLPKVWVDSNQLEQVFVNLLSNASDAIEESRDQGGVITIHTQLDQQDPEYVDIYIKDNGTGINTSYLQNIFDPFFSTKTNDKGCGLGLSITYDIIKDHRGEITVFETGEKGTVFRIKIPVYTGAVEASLKEAGN